MKRHLNPQIQKILICIIIVQFIIGSGIENIPLAITNLILLVVNVLIIKKYGKVNEEWMNY